jgi:hypothetical protein
MKNETEMNTDFLTTIGEIIVSASKTEPELTATNIRLMHTQEKGSETLRLIVRDNLGGAGDIIANAIF